MADLPFSEFVDFYSFDVFQSIKDYGGTDKDDDLVPGLTYDEAAKARLKDTLAAAHMLKDISGDQWLDDALGDFLRDEAKAIEEESVFFRAIQYMDRLPKRTHRIDVLRGACEHFKGQRPSWSGLKNYISALLQPSPQNNLSTSKKW